MASPHMANWEYKVISSGKGGFASPALMEKFINDLGQEQWEIISFHQPPDNPLAFHGLARRPTERDWTLEDAAKAAARAEADKLRAEFEAKFKAATAGAPAAPAEEQGETFLAEEKVGTDDGLRRLRDTSRDDDPDAAEEEGGEAPANEWDKIAEEDELPSFFDALKPHMRRNQRGPGMSVGVDFLAKKWRLDESDIKTALVECGMQIPADEDAKPVYVEYEGDLYWVNINRRGEIWINVREKPEPRFRIVPGRRITEEAAVEAGAPAPSSEPAPEGESASSAAPASETPAAPKTFLDRIRGMMRRNRGGGGWSGSFGFLTKALKTDEAGLLALLAEQGLKMAPEGSEKPEFFAEGDFLYWMQKNARGEIWINARRERRSAAPEAGAPAEAAAPSEAPAGEAASAAEPAATAVEEPAAAVVAPADPARAASTLAAVRLLLQPKKRGEGVAALVSDVSAQLGKPAIELLEALVAAGLNVPDDTKTKPTFGEHGGEIFWLNRNAKDELWLNAKPVGARKGRSRRKEDGEPEAEEVGD